MKYFFFFLLCISVTYHASALESVRFSQASDLPHGGFDTDGIKSHPYVDFGQDVSAIKLHHIVEVFPKDSTENTHRALIPEYTPEFQKLRNMFSSDVWNILWHR